MIAERKSSSANPVHSGRTDPQKTIPINEALEDGTATRLRPLTPLVRERRLRRVLALIESQSASCVRELALEVGLSPAHLQRLFKHETGLYISQLLSERRLQRAAHLLSASDLQIKEIAYAVGYEHHSSFVRAFRRRFDHSPKQYRQPGDATAQKAK
jgi:AraC-like DNA-binding protein